MTTITETNITQQLDFSEFTIVLPEDSLGVVEYVSAADFPGVGKDRRLYVAQNSGQLFRWNGTAYAPAADLPVTYSDTPPAHPYTGQRWTTTFDLITYEYFAGAWVEKPTNN